MQLEKINRQAVTFCAVALLFAGSLYYFVSVAFDNQDVLMNRQEVRIDLDTYFEEQEMNKGADIPAD